MLVEEIIEDEEDCVEHKTPIMVSSIDSLMMS